MKALAFLLSILILSSCITEENATPLESSDCAEQVFQNHQLQLLLPLEKLKDIKSVVFRDAFGNERNYALSLEENKMLSYCSTDDTLFFTSWSIHWEDTTGPTTPSTMFI